jgi:hypothetical protein
MIYVIINGQSFIKNQQFAWLKGFFYNLCIDFHLDVGSKPGPKLNFQVFLGTWDKNSSLTQP